MGYLRRWLRLRAYWNETNLMNVLQTPGKKAAPKAYGTALRSHYGRADGGF
jgi:hypothetical protein